MISEEERVQVWGEIRKASRLINRAGGNTVELLLWSRGRSVRAVRRRIHRILYGGQTAGTERNYSHIGTVRIETARIYNNNISYFYSDRISL